MTAAAAFDSVDAEAWHRLLQNFDDASIFQTHAYGTGRWGARNLSHAVIWQRGELIGLAQCVLAGGPGIGKILAYVPFGPVWQPRGSAPDPGRLEAVLAALHQEYVVRRGLCLRLRPWTADRGEAALVAKAVKEPWHEAGSLAANSTCVVDLSRPLADLRRGTDKRWRANLRKAERYGLRVTEAGGSDAVRIHCALHREMEQRKGFKSQLVDLLPGICARLPAGLKPRIFVCWQGDAAVASAVVSAMGNRAIYLHGATARTALEVRAGYLLQWSIVLALKETGACRWYDLLGTRSTAGVRQFKKGLAGPGAPEIFMTEFEACGSRLSAYAVSVGMLLRELRLRLRKRAVTAD